MWREYRGDIKRVFPEQLQVECRLYNNHYSAQMAVQRGLSVHGPETLWLDSPCVAIFLCAWMVSLFLHFPLDCSETLP